MLWAWLVALYVVQAVGLTFLALRDAAHPVRALAWVIIGLLVPVLGLCVYWIFARPLHARRTRHRTKAHTVAKDLTPWTDTESSRNIAVVIHSMTGTKPAKADLRVFHDGRSKYEALLKALKSATHTIDLEYYIFRDDHIGKKVMDVLCAKSDAGVKVRFLRDGLGSRSLSARAIQKLQQHGIHCRTFFPFRFPWLTPRLNHRDHCKIVVVDNEQAFVGGINIGDEYTGRKPEVGPWRDTHVQVRGHESAIQLLRVFEMNWNTATPDEKGVERTVYRPRSPFSNGRRLLSTRLATSGEWATELSTRVDKIAADSSGRSPRQGYVQTVESGPDSKIESIRNLFFTCLTESERNVDITTPYFVPDTDILTAMRSAVLKGVQVRLLVPLQPDHKAVGYASRTFYEELLDVGVRVYLYDHATLHAKVMTVDHEISIVGAANYDVRSFRLNYEVCQVLYSTEVVEQLTQQFEDDIRQSIHLTREWISNRSRWDSGKERFARLFAPLL